MKFNELMINKVKSQLADMENIAKSTDKILNSFNDTKSLYIPKGVYTLTQNISQIPNNVIIHGDGIDNTIIDGNTYSIEVSGLQNVIFSDITFTNFNEIQLSGYPKNIEFKRCKFTDMKTRGIILVNYTNIKFDGCILDTIGSSSVDPTWQGCGIYADTGDDLKVQNCDISHTYGHGCIFCMSSTNLYIKKNKFHDTAYRGIILYTGTHSGLIDDNDVYNCGIINPTASGVGCNGIYSLGASYDVIVSNNRIINVYENAIEGLFKLIEHNYINGTGTNYSNHPTPSIEGIYPYQSANKVLIKNNIILNTLGDGIKYYSSDTIANFTIEDNTIEDDASNSNYAIEINSTVGYSNVYIIGNTIRNKINGIYLANKPCIDCWVSNNKPINVSILYPFALQVKTNDGNIANVLTNREFSSWTDTTHLSNWNVANGNLSQVTDNNSYIPQLTNSSNGYATRFTQDIYLPKVGCFYYVKTKFKGTDNITIKLIPYNIDGTTLNYAAAQLLTSSVFLSDTFKEFTVLFSANCVKYQLDIEIATATQGNYIIIQSIMDKIITQ